MILIEGDLIVCVSVSGKKFFTRLDLHFPVRRHDCLTENGEKKPDKKVRIEYRIEESRMHIKMAYDSKSIVVEEKLNISFHKQNLNSPYRLKHEEGREPTDSKK